MAPLPAPCMCQTLHSSLARCSDHGALESTPGHQQRLPQPARCFSSAPLRADQGHRQGAAMEEQNPPQHCLPAERASEPSKPVLAGTASSQSRVTHQQPARLSQPEHLCVEQPGLRRKGSFPRRCANVGRGSGCQHPRHASAPPRAPRFRLLHALGGWDTACPGTRAACSWLSPCLEPCPALPVPAAAPCPWHTGSHRDPVTAHPSSRCSHPTSGRLAGSSPHPPSRQGADVPRLSPSPPG